MTRHNAHVLAWLEHRIARMEDALALPVMRGVNDRLTARAKKVLLGLNLEFELETFAGARALQLEVGGLR